MFCVPLIQNTHVCYAQLTAGETEMRLNQIENKIAREALRSQALDASLVTDTQTRDVAIASLHARETALTTLDVESRRNRVAIARQEENLVRLQRKINAIVARREEDGAGNAESSPLELERDVRVYNRLVGTCKNIVTQLHVCAGCMCACVFEDGHWHYV